MGRRSFPRLPNWQQQAAQAKQTEDRVTQQIDAAYQQADAQRRAAAEADGR